MIINSKKSSRRKLVAYIFVGIITLFYSITLIIQLNGGKGDYTETLWDMALFFAFVVIAYLIFPSDYFEFKSDVIHFRDYRRRTVQLSDIDYIYYKDNFILLETKDEKKYEISISNFDSTEFDLIKSKFKDLDVRELSEETQPN